MTASPPTTTPIPRGSAGSAVLGAVLLALGVLISIAGSSVLAAGLLVGSAELLRDEDGYVSSPTETFSSDSFAITSTQVSGLTVDRGGPHLPFDLATVRLSAESPEGEVFIGIASSDDVERYLGDVDRSEIREVRYMPFEVEYRDRSGPETPEPPEAQDIWAASASGPGAQELTWDLVAGDWGVVVMNADASRGVTAEVQAGVRSELIAPAATALIVVGSVLLLVGIPLIVIGAVLLGRAVPRRPAPLAVPPSGAALGAPTVVRAVRVTGVRDEPLSRWLWIVKGILVIPHILILAVLGAAVAITTIAAGVMILITGRYPRSLFDFAVGVLRWAWRVGFYSFSALGTDRYPPFTLAHTDYPADLDIDYPERLSRGLALVKWWLLAIPHYILIGAVSGQVVGWQAGDDDGGMRVTGISLLTALVLIAGVALLFTARYPAGIFDLVMGVNRWSWRVIAYVALLRDEYPPFRLDQGALEPVLAAPTATGAP